MGFSGIVQLVMGWLFSPPVVVTAVKGSATASHHQLNRATASHYQYGSAEASHE